jgi:hypothetical protein
MRGGITFSGWASVNPSACQIALAMTTSQLATMGETGSPAIVRPFRAKLGTKKAPTDALRLVGAISLSAVVGGLHPHQR